MIKKQKHWDLKSKPKVRFCSRFVCVCARVSEILSPVSVGFIVHFDTHHRSEQKKKQNRREWERNRIDKTKLNIIYIWVSLLGCLKPLPELERIIFFGPMSFNRHSIQRAAACNIHWLHCGWIQTRLAQGFRSFVRSFSFFFSSLFVIFWLAFRKFSG